MNTFLDVTLNKRNVVSKNLFKEIENLIQSYVSDAAACWDSEDYRLAVENVVDEDMTYVSDETSLLESWKVVCNDRNNPEIETKNNIYTLDIFYRQINCIVTTHLQFKIKWYIISEKKNNVIKFEDSW